jgi:hypothetical protein
MSYHRPSNIGLYLQHETVIKLCHLHADLIVSGNNERQAIRMAILISGDGETTMRLRVPVVLSRGMP